MTRIGKTTHLAVSILAGLALLTVSATGVGPLPPLGTLLNPATGVWTIASAAQLPHTQTRQLPGLKKPVDIWFTADGSAYIKASTDYDLFFTIGYLQAKFRLFQMDLMRRQGEGLLSQVVGPAALSSDTFEDTLGIARTAVQEWLLMRRGSSAYDALTAFTAGVNARMNQDEATHDLPYMFKLLHYQPTPWTPVDTLVIQGDLTQTLDLSTSPIDYALLVHSLGYARTMDFFPVLPKDTQHPYDLGPYKTQPIAPIDATPTVTAAEAIAAQTLAHQVEQLPAGLVHKFSDSNNWAVAGFRTASGKPLMAGDPHLNQTLPSVWYQLTAQAPGYSFSGVTVPGLPIILIGHNAHISWSLTDVQNQSSLFYKETTSPLHPGRYLYKGRWVPFQTLHYEIPVKGQHAKILTVTIAAQGPLLTSSGMRLAIDWMGATPSPDLQSLLDLVKARDFTQFRKALALWHAPTQNFVYADRSGNIGMISAGYYPIINASAPWLPLPGTGSADVIGTIPYSAVPAVYDPRSGVVFSANQREVGPSYPYYIGTTDNDFSNGYRADEIYESLINGRELTATDMERLQNSTRDYLASRIVPDLLHALTAHPLTGRAREAASVLGHWNDNMGVHSIAASIWWTFWSQYLQDTFGPWWRADHVDVAADSNLAISPQQASLDEDLEYWTQDDPRNAAFTPPGTATRTSAQVMRLAFSQTVRDLTTRLGENVNAWQWGRLHTRAFPSLTQAPGLGYGPRASSGDEWTIDAADGYPVAQAGPSWRFVMDWGTKIGYGVYPGGQSENPLSPWYEDQISTWWNGHYFPMFTFSQAQQQSGTVHWTIQP